jgi:hypothetical protein
MTQPVYQPDSWLLATYHYEWVHEWVYTALSKMKPAGSAYIVIDNDWPSVLRAYLNAPVPDGVRLEDILIWTQEGNFDHSQGKENRNYKRNFLYRILYYRGKDSPPLNEPVTITDVVTEKNKENIANCGLYIIQSSNEDDIVVDPFCRDANIIYTASKLGRKSCGAVYEDLEDDNAVSKSRILQLLTGGSCKLGEL